MQRWLKRSRLEGGECSQLTVNEEKQTIIGNGRTCEGRDPWHM